ncbi:MAG: hypothetical protein ACLVEJ_01130 [Parabacteroides sp.]
MEWKVIRIWMKESGGYGDTKEAKRIPHLATAWISCVKYSTPGAQNRAGASGI